MDISLSNSSQAENLAANSVVGALTTTDPDSGNTFTYTLVTGTGSTDNASFNISGANLRTSAIFNYETQSSYSIRLRSTDQGGLNYEKVFTVSVSNVNETPTDISLSSSSVAENLAANTVVGALSTTDPDSANTFTYTLVSGTGSTDNASFNISGANLRTSSVFNYESKNSYSIRLRSTDQGGLYYEKVFTVSVTNVNETPTDISLSSSSLAENLAANTVVGALSTTDPDSTNTFTYTLVSGTDSTDNGAFNVSGANLQSSASFNYESKNSYSIRLRSTDQGGLYYEKVFTITITDVNETPTNIIIDNASVVDGLSINTLVGAFTTTDPDSGNTFAYSLVGGDTTSFNISGPNLQTSEIFDFETKSSYSVTVRSTDQDGLFYEKVFPIIIINSAKKNPIVTWPTASPITFGQKLADSTLSGGSAKDENDDPLFGVFAFTTPTDIPGAGTAPQYVTFTPTNTSYNPVTSTISVNVVVFAMSANVTAWPTASSIIYGQTLNESNLIGGSASTPGSFAFTMPSTTPNVGTDYQSVTFTPFDSNYNSVTDTTHVTVIVDKAGQSIAFTSTAPSGAVVGGSAYPPAATGGASGIAVVFTIDNSASSVCSISSGNVSFLTVGTCTINANQSGNSNFAAAPQVQQSFTVGIGDQIINFTTTAPSDAVVGWAYTPAATGGASGIAVVFTIDSTATPICSISGNTVSFQTIGNCVINANQAGNTNYNAAPQVQQSFLVGRAIPNVTAWPIASAITYGQTLADSNLSSGSASVAGSFAFTNPSTAPNAGAALQNVTFTPDDSSNYSPVTGTVSVTVAMITPVITFGTAPTPTYLDNFTVNATTSNSDSSALIYSRVSGPCAWINGSTFSTTGGGTCVVQVDGAATTNFHSATQTQSISISKVTPMLTWTNPLDIVYGTALSATQLNASAGSVSGTLVYTPAAGTVLPVGVHILHVAFTPTDPANSDGADKDVSLTVTVPLPPTITGLSLDLGPTAGGSPVVISGTNLFGGTVTFGGAAATCTVDSTTQITCTSPAHLAGTVNVEITTPGGTTAPNLLFTYIQKMMLGISPSQGFIGGGTSVTLSGAGFTDSTTASFGGIAATCVTASDSQITCVTAAHTAGQVDVLVTTNATVLSAANGFTYLPLPIAEVNPGNGPTTGGTAVTITGAGFNDTTAITFDGNAVACSISSATQMNCTTPPHAAGMVNVLIANAGATTYTGAFTYYQSYYSATITPNLGSLLGGTTVTLTDSTGTDFSGATAVTFGGTNAVSFTVISATQVRAVTPAHSAGMVDIVISAPGGPYTYSNSFTFSGSTLPLASSSTPVNGSITIASESPSQLQVKFNMDILHVIPTDPDWHFSATNPVNYLLVSAGANGVFDTQTCLANLQGDDRQITIDSIFYDPATYTVTLNTNDGQPLPIGSYQLMACGTTSIKSLVGVKLNSGLDDTRFYFAITVDPPIPAQEPNKLPATGFTPNRITALPIQNQAYTVMDDLKLEIPTIAVEGNIMGVPQSNSGWDLTWLGKDVGWLQGSAYPTWNGNSVLTGHVSNADGTPGIFVNLGKMHWGDKITVKLQRQSYIYEVRQVLENVSPSDIDALMAHKENPWLTLVTCQGYDIKSDNYRWRILVRAVLVKVE
jgi:LPXTG-site transpeptidase (sortase) family protein